MGELEHKIRAEMEKLRGRCGPNLKFTGLTHNFSVDPAV
jgi:hypothetical protein